MESETQNELCRSCEARAYPVEAPRKQVPNTESATEFRASERIKRRNKFLVFNPRRSAAKWFGVKTNAARPATEPHRSWIPASALSPLGDEMTASVRQRPRSFEREAPPWPKRVAHSSSCDDKGATAAAASGPCFLHAVRRLRSEEQRAKKQRARGGGRNARATSCARARF
jgi:hypothetical protein